MSRVRWTALIAAAALLGVAHPVAAGSTRFEERLQRAVASGAVDPQRADLYRLLRLRAAERLPEVLREAQGPAARSAQRPLGAERPSRDGTAEMRLLRARLAQASAAIRAEAEHYLSAAPAATERPAAARVAGKTGGKTLLNRVVTDNFSVEWGSELTNENGTSPAADTGPAFSGDPAVGGNGVPDVVERWAGYLEASFGVVAGMGFEDPLVSSSLVPVYLGNSDPDRIEDDINSSRYFGFTDQVGNQVPYLVVNNDFRALLGLTGVTAIQQFMKVTAAHEFFHVFHWLYDSTQTEAEIDEDIWWWEASATWMEDEVFDSIDDYFGWFDGTYVDPGWAELAEEGLAPDYTDTTYAARAYGGVIFAKYLAEHVGGRDSMGKMWNRIRGGTRVLAAFDAYAVSRGFDGLEHLFVGFVGANAVMDYEEGAHYGQVSAPSPASGSTAPVSYLGASYRSRPPAPAGGVEISVPVAPATDWGLSGVLDSAAGFSLVVGGRLGSGTTPSAQFANVGARDSVFVAASWLTKAPAIPFTLAEASFTSPDIDAPAVVGLGAPLARAGGFDLSWTPPADFDVAGYVVNWESRAPAGDAGYRTFFGPVTAAELRGLTPGTYDLQVFAYDTVGNADLAAAATATVTVAELGSDATVPVSAAAIPNALVKALDLGTPPPPPTGGGGGGGGGGCFVQSLGF
ncbi:MAG: fibronectin type III domain-containing protein [Deferrisomatales bacterium]|nr:fibronectin type III domain-containing protein [Deferrisomatales bacterium]